MKYLKDTVPAVSLMHMNIFIISSGVGRPFLSTKLLRIVVMPSFTETNFISVKILVSWSICGK